MEQNEGLNVMSQKSIYAICCPKCQAEFKTSLFDSVNVTESPEDKLSLLRNKLNRVDCPECNYNFRIDKQLIYTDLERKFMVLLIPATLETLEEAEEEFQLSILSLNELLPDGTDAPSIYLSIDWAEMIELIFLDAEKIDAREAEYIKYLIYTQNPETIDPEKKRLLFNRQESTPEALKFVVQDAETYALEQVVEFEQKAYSAIKETFEDDAHTGLVMEMFSGPYISARRLLLEKKI